MPRRKYIDLFYKASLSIKGVDAVFELIASVAVIFLTPRIVFRAITKLTYGELVRDPKDVVANYLLHLARTFSIDTQIFAFLYLFTHGMVKLFLVVGLLQKKAWAYPTAFIFLPLFILYEVYRFTQTHSILLLIFAALDLFILCVVLIEYRRK